MMIRLMNKHLSAHIQFRKSVGFKPYAFAKLNVYGCSYLYTLTLIFIGIQLFAACNTTPKDSIPQAETEIKKGQFEQQQAQPVLTGASQVGEYFRLIGEQKVGLVVNQTSQVGAVHLVDTLLALGVDIQKIFAPEHGFRGTADAGEKVKDGKDTQTGLPIVSLYGKNKKPSAAMLEGLDMVVFDIQDVGARFYTYISTMSYVMEACAEQGIPVLVLDRPNPNGHYVDGPVLDPAKSSFVGLHEVPVVHGMTVAEYARMVNSEGWLKDGVQCKLSYIKCKNYTHDTPYELPIKPSPNLPNARSIYLYPSLCFFEGTAFSVGRGTDQQFQVIGHPDNTIGDYTFTPVPKPGAKYPKHENKVCNGLNLSKLSKEAVRQKAQLQLTYLIDMYQAFPDKASFFNENNFFNLLAGNTTLQAQIKAGKTEEEIRRSWQEDLNNFKRLRKKYLLYP